MALNFVILRMLIVIEQLFKALSFSLKPLASVHVTIQTATFVKKITLEWTYTLNVTDLAGDVLNVENALYNLMSDYIDAGPLSLMFKACVNRQHTQYSHQKWWCFRIHLHQHRLGIQLFLLIVMSYW